MSDEHGTPSNDDLSPQKTNREAFRDALRRKQAVLPDNEKIPQSDLPQDPAPPQPPAKDDIVTKPLTPTKTPDDRTAPRKLGEQVDGDVRKVLRRVQKHLLEAQVGLGAEHTTVNLTEVLYHPTNRIGSLNYITPRQKTAWVTANQIQHGIDYLAARDRTVRFQYIEGLYPPVFARSLVKLGLTIESEVPLMIYLADAGELTSPADDTLTPPPSIHIQQVDDVRGAEVWWYVWKNAHYDVMTLGVEPLFVGRGLSAIKLGQQIDLIAHQGRLPFGVARVSIYQKTAHIVGVAIFKEMETDDTVRYLIQHARDAALAAGADLVFISGDTDVDRARVRKLGFMDFGSLVCYSASAKSDEPGEKTETTHDKLAQPVLNLKSTRTQFD